jgi:hypothetical protein
VTEGESKGPEDASSAMPHQGVLSIISPSGDGRFSFVHPERVRVALRDEDSDGSMHLLNLPLVLKIPNRNPTARYPDHARSPDHPITRFPPRTSPIQNQSEADEPHC